MDATSTADVPESLPILSSQEIIEHELGEDFPSPPSSPHLITANEQWNNQEPEDLLMEDFLVKCELEIPTKNTNEAINGEIAESQETSDAVFEEVCQKPEIGEETNEAAASSSTTVAAAISPPIPPARKMLQSKLSGERLFSACSPPPLPAAEEKGCCDEKNVVAAASAPKPVRRVPPPLPPKPTVFFYHFYFIKKDFNFKRIFQNSKNYARKCHRQTCVPADSSSLG